MDNLKALLGRAPDAPLIPELVGMSPAVIAATERGKAALGWANQAKGQPIPLTTYTLYRGYRASGDRGPYEGPYFGKRVLLTQHALAAWLGTPHAGPEAERAINEVNDLVWAICEETTWVVPYHEKGNAWMIDLYNAETASELTHVVLLLGDRLPEEIRTRIHNEVERRVLDPYLEHASQYFWNVGFNNWTGVCAGSVGEAFLILETDPERQARGLALVLGQLARFIEHGYEEDGGCLEGIGYWNYGLSHYVSFAEMLRARTDGAIDLLAQDKLKRIAQFPAVVALDKHVFASFGDSNERSSLQPYLAARLAERTGVESLRCQVGDWGDSRLSAILRNLLWWDGTDGGAPIIEDAFLPVSSIGKRVGTAAGRRVVLCARAGHNYEPHNHNDVGSFVLRIGGVTYLCDPGPGLYNADYFSAKRYQNVFTNSYGHSVPRIGGALQGSSRRNRGTMTMGDGVIRVTFPEAYDLPQLKDLVRTLRIEQDGAVTLEDAYAFDGDGLEVEEALMTWLDVQLDGNVARLTSNEGVLEIQAEGATFRAERLEKASKENQARGILTRITAVYIPAPKTTARFTMRFVPHP